MKRIVRILATAAFAVFSAVSLNAQDIAAATETFNAGATALQAKNYTLAIENFTKALKMAEGLGDEGASIVKDSKDMLPQLYMYLGQDLASMQKPDEAVVQLKKAVEVAKLYGKADVEKEATSLIPKVFVADAISNLNNGKLPEAIASYQKAIEITPDNSELYLGIGVAQLKLNDEASAITSFAKAIELGDKDNAPAQLSTIYLKKAQAAATAKNWAVMLDNAKKANSAMISSNGQKFAGIASLNLKKYDDAISFMGQYLESDPTAKDKDNMLYYIGTAYEAKANNAKACEFYKKILANPTFKAIVEYKVKALSCK
jgi:tetratricopeptide (TPR) repeat protein